MSKLTKEERERVERYVRDYDVRSLAGMLIELEQGLERTRRDHRKDIARQAKEAADMIEELLSDDPEMPTHGDTVQRAEALLEALRRKGAS